LQLLNQLFQRTLPHTATFHKFSSVFRLNFRMNFSSTPYAVAVRRRGRQYKLLGPGGPEWGPGPDYVAYVSLSLTVVSLVVDYTN